jgi:hypothetical protein
VLWNAKRLIDHRQLAAGMRVRGACPIPELFNPDESKRAEKMLELAILSLFKLR